jgi:thioredoxin 2
MPVIRTCRTRGRKNRVPVGHLSGTGRCGVCKAPLPPLGDPLEVDPELLNEVVQNAHVPGLIDFWPPGAGPAGWQRLRLHAQPRIWPDRRLS